jgi:hypothetical protein
MPCSIRLSTKDAPFYSREAANDGLIFVLCRSGGAIDYLHMFTRSVGR